MQPWRKHLADHEDDAVEALKAFLRIPSVSTEEDHRDDCREAAQWVWSRLEPLGFEGGPQQVGDGHPVVAGRLTVDDEAPTVVLYGHYDVQPPDPLDAWTTPPFEPTVGDGRIRARGATDDKGQLLANLLAVEAHAKAGTLGVNVQVLVEGEEESGGESLPTYLEGREGELACDAVIVSDTHLWDREHPAIVHGLRGIVTMEVRVRGPERDLHSGSYGGAVTNPLEALARALASLKDDEGRVRVPGFYDDVLEPGDDERVLMDQVPFDEKAFVDETGIPALGGEQVWSPLERLWARPTLEVNGLAGGYAGKGFKTVLPSEAVAKVSCRLVPRQDAAVVGDAVVDKLTEALPRQVTVDAKVLATAPAWYVPPDNPVLRTAADCLEEAFGGTCLFIREGGSIPVVPTLGRLGPVVLMGYGMRDERLHAPDEFFRLEHFHKGAVACGLVLERMGQRAGA